MWKVIIFEKKASETKRCTARVKQADDTADSNSYLQLSVWLTAEVRHVQSVTGTAWRKKTDIVIVSRKVPLHGCP